MRARQIALTLIAILVMAVSGTSLIRTVHDRKRPGSLNLGLGQPSLPVPAR